MGGYGVKRVYLLHTLTNLSFSKFEEVLDWLRSLPKTTLPHGVSYYYY
jgi:hypothetical protein